MQAEGNNSSESEEGQREVNQHRCTCICIYPRVEVTGAMRRPPELAKVVQENGLLGLLFREFTAAGVRGDDENVVGPTLLVPPRSQGLQRRTEVGREMEGIRGEGHKRTEWRG